MLSLPPSWVIRRYGPQQQPADHAAQPDQHDLEPAGQRRRVHDQVDGEQVDRRAGAEDRDVEDRRDDGVGEPADAGAGRPQQADRAEDRRGDDRPSEDQEAEQDQQRRGEVEHREHDRGEHRDEAGADPVHVR